MADLKRQNFDPDNVLMSEAKDGTLLDEFNAPVMQEVIENSKVFQLGVAQDMGGKAERTFSFWGDKPGAYWVGEGRKIETTKPTMITANMRAHKVATIVVVSREYLNYTYSDFFNAIRPQLAEALYKKIDEAVILNEDNPFSQSVDQAATNSGNVVEGDITVENVLALQDALYDHDVEPNGIVSKRQNRTALRGLRDADNVSYFDRVSNTIDGIQAVDLKSTAMPKGTLYAGDFDNLYYGIPYNINYSISEEAQISTIKNEDGSAVNLFEQELLALRVTMDVATLIANEDAFAKLAPEVVEEV